MVPATSNSHPVQASRLVFVDLLRGWAIIVMIETHVFNAMIVPQASETAWFDVLNFINGLVAPSFLFVSGFVFVLSTRRKIDELRTFGTAFWRQVGRMLIIWIIAYVLHLPFFSFRRIVAQATSEEWLTFFQADILHCIVVGWFFLLGSVLLIRLESRYRQWLLLSGLASVLITPLIWGIDFAQFIPAPIAAYLNGKQYSMFPLFPWLGFMLAGSYVALWFVDAAEKGIQKEFVAKVGLIGGGMVVLSFMLSLVSLQVAYLSSWRANPLFFFLRLGIVFLLLGACWYYAEHRGTERSFVLDVSRESFLVYVAHLLLIYGNYFENGKSLTDIYGKSFSVFGCVLATLALATLMVVLAKIWGWLKRRSVVASRAVSLALAAITAALFFIREY